MDYCTNCGQPLRGTAFCTHCGAPVQAGQPSAAPEYDQPTYAAGSYSAPSYPPPSYGSGPSAPVYDAYAAGYTAASSEGRSKNSIVAAVIAIVAVIALIFGGLNIYARSPKKVAKDYVKAIFNADADKMFNLLPPKVTKKIVDEEFNGDKKKAKDSLKSMLNMVSSSAYGGVKFSSVSVNVKEVNSVDKDRLKSLKEEYDKQGFGKISDAKDVKLELSYKGSKDTLNCRTVKIGGRWYVDYNGIFL